MPTRSIGRMVKPHLPHHIVTEAIGNFTLTGSDENQIHIAEQIASNSYTSMDQLCDTIKGYARRKTFAQEFGSVKTNTYFKEYWEND